MKNSTWMILLGCLIFSGCATGTKTEYVFETSDERLSAEKVIECNTPLSEEISSKFGDSYEYAVMNQINADDCVACVYERTKIRVAEGKVIRRDYTKTRIIEDVEVMISEWTETEEEIGSHSEGFLPRTIKEISSTCPSLPPELETTASL